MPPPEAVSKPRERAVLEECQVAIGYRFTKPELLRAALTHTSSANTRGASNERLEFLGDSVLGLVTCEQLFTRFPDYQEGDLTKVKSVVVSRKTCASFSQEIGLGDFLFLGKGVVTLRRDPVEHARRRVRVDGRGHLPRRRLGGGQGVRAALPRARDRAGRARGGGRELQVAAANRDPAASIGGTPRYSVLDEQGPDHDKCFKVAAQVGEHRFPAAWGRTKKEAELKAALNALAYIREEDLPFPSD